MAQLDPKKQQKEYIIVGVLVVAALFIGLNRLKKGEKKEDEIFSRSEYNKKWEEVKKLEKEVAKEEAGIIYTVEGKRIPFKSPLEEVKIIAAREAISLPAGLSFQGMIWNSIRPQAVINSRVYDLEDTISIGEDKVFLKAIAKDGIHLKYKGKEFIVKPNTE